MKHEEDEIIDDIAYYFLPFLLFVISKYLYTHHIVLFWSDFVLLSSAFTVCRDNILLPSRSIPVPFEILKALIFELSAEVSGHSCCCRSIVNSDC